MKDQPVSRAKVLSLSSVLNCLLVKYRLCVGPRSINFLLFTCYLTKAIHTVPPFHMDIFIKGKNASKPQFLSLCISPSSALRVEDYGHCRIGKDGVVLLPRIPLSVVAGTKILSKDHRNSHMGSSKAPSRTNPISNSGQWQMLEERMSELSDSTDLSCIPNFQHSVTRCFLG